MGRPLAGINPAEGRPCQTPATRHQTRHNARSAPKPADPPNQGSATVRKALRGS